MKSWLLRNRDARTREVLPGLAELEGRLGYRFSDPALLVQALTHASFANESNGEAADNERMEFLGDAVLGLAVARLLYETERSRPEGDLSRMRAAMVSEPTLARLAREIGLGPFLRLGRGEAASGGRNKDSILADAMEAVVGAIYLDAGFPRARRMVYRLFAPLMSRDGERSLAGDYKTRLQEYAQSALHVTPTYELLAEEGPDHDKTFTVRVSAGEHLAAVGEGKSKKSAQQQAAKNAWMLIKEKPPVKKHSS
ncbi:MAG: ribonuclease III [Deltaproteobacteria bacterium]|nr:ribonuclease III [Deltaproteobacteria bacterium]